MSNLFHGIIRATATSAAVLLALPLTAYGDVAPTPRPFRCGAMGGLTLSLLLVACGCWLVRTQMRPRK